ncbi:MAG: bifunctional glutamate N-acetyltransferase/amino-acid acetyltransferase ArgJ [Cellvibrionales bacterium]|jgi:glutamate N-acetyltransferase/amino-acid N-acetyltransferase|nr:bifunctional glutamate N-acetyltransferase/amino-acid acetyltransferase ArgJ [Cellvibrionales bacterium]MBK8675205.1 bifunctional glutamate N-acetyltransferase/amino-acid acetyltransferase ArgJ [Cellvibrionales bacterium]TXH49364.1 MAG: bifunctional glutamate N-acetyltransferase/amino-acid acetyltransferase ArgJ [Cellvibrionales bacterium]HRG49632.1 bifunctional glutamate N-acetyltransferase/amino-acid acetyltransferase ArgJ [Pseudomonadales bacterium]
MAVGSGTIPEIFPVAGVRIGVAEAGIRKQNRKDLVVFELAENTSVAAVFTKNAFCAAPVHVAKKHLAEQACRYWLINTGCANAGTGEQGMLDARNSCAALAKITGVAAENILPFSTGVIGELLPMEKLAAGLAPALNNLSSEHWLRAAEGIMTTDTRPKIVSRKIVLDGKEVTVTGISKGAGMIKPNMATMLGFVATDAQVAQKDLQTLLQVVADKSFNRITIDGDTSTNDACMLAATGCSGVVLIPQSIAWVEFASAIEAVFVELAQAIVRDGEGATKFISVVINGGNNSDECLRAAYAIAESPLVKTALFASDPNWGRILAAIGRSGIADLDTSRINIFLNGVQIVENGGRAPAYTEAQGVAAMAPEEIVIRVELQRGAVSETVWTCDFSHDYVTINAEYRT